MGRKHTPGQLGFALGESLPMVTAAPAAAAGRPDPARLEAAARRAVEFLSLEEPMAETAKAVLLEALSSDGKVRA